MTKVYWTQKDGTKIDVDEMSLEYLRNTLKFIIRKSTERTITDAEINEEFDDYVDKLRRDGNREMIDLAGND